MRNLLNNKKLIRIENNIEETIKRIKERGIDETNEDFDDYSELIKNKEFKYIIIYELYENYFPPRRHEFELQILTEIVNAISQSKEIAFVAGAMASGIIGEVAIKIARKLFMKVITNFKHSKSERDKFKNLLNDINKIDKYFFNKNIEEINLLSKKIGLEKEKLIPLLKLLGFKKYIRKNNSYWAK